MIENEQKEAEKGPVINRIDCKNYCKCLSEFALRCFESDVKNLSNLPKNEKSCIECGNYEMKK